MNAAAKRRDVLVLGASAFAFAWWMSGIGRGSPTNLNAPEVDLAQARALIEAGAIVLDVRGKEAFDYRHLPPAVLMPLAEVSIQNLLESLAQFWSSVEVGSPPVLTWIV